MEIGQSYPTNEELERESLSEGYVAPQRIKRGRCFPEPIYYGRPKNGSGAKIEGTYTAPKTNQQELSGTYKAPTEENNADIPGNTAPKPIYTIEGDCYTGFVRDRWLPQRDFMPDHLHAFLSDQSIG